MNNKANQKNIFVLVTGGTFFSGSFKTEQEQREWVRTVYNINHLKVGLKLESCSALLSGEFIQATYDRIVGLGKQQFELLGREKDFETSEIHLSHERAYASISADISTTFMLNLANIVKDAIEKEKEYSIPKAFDELEYDHKEFDPLIDSIIMNFGHHTKFDEEHIDHFQQLLDEAREAFKNNDSVILVGGTDTKHFYTAISKVLESEGYFDQGKKLIFVSSMQNFKENPRHNVKLFQAAQDIALSDGLSGGAFVVSSLDKEASKIVIQDPIDSFTKISSGLHNPFRSKDLIGYYEDKKLDVKRDYESKNNNRISYDDEIGIRKVAPPIIFGSGMDSIIKDLRSKLIANQSAILNGDKPVYDSLIIEYDDRDFNPPDTRKFKYFKELVNIATETGLEIVVNNSINYNQLEEKFEFFNDEDRFRNNQFVNQLVELGISIESRATKDVISDQWIYSRLEYKLSENNIPDLPKFLDKKSGVIIQYHPDQQIFKRAVEDSAKNFECMTVCGLPGMALPNEMVQVLEENFPDGRFSISFKGNESERLEYDGSKFIEGHEPTHYSAASDSVKHSTYLNPQNALQKLKQQHIGLVKQPH